jgi:cytidylate kinase
VLGAGGGRVGQLVAARLGFQYVDEEIIARAAAKAGVDVERIVDEERRKSMFSGLLDHLHDAAESSPPAREWTDDLAGEDVRELIRDAIHEIAERGHVVIVAHAASFAVGPGPQALRLLVTAPHETRLRRLVAGGMSETDAAKEIRRSDENRSDYLKRFYGVVQELPIHYDLVVNTDTISFEQAAEWIGQAVAGERVG